MAPPPCRVERCSDRTPRVLPSPLKCLDQNGRHELSPISPAMEWGLHPTGLPSRDATPTERWRSSEGSSPIPDLRDRPCAGGLSRMCWAFCTRDCCFPGAATHSHHVDASVQPSAPPATLPRHQFRSARYRPPAIRISSCDSSPRRDRPSPRAEPPALAWTSSRLAFRCSRGSRAFRSLASRRGCVRSSQPTVSDAISSAAARLDLARRRHHAPDTRRLQRPREAELVGSSYAVLAAARVAARATPTPHDRVGDRPYLPLKPDDNLHMV
jgi:hypothetical protein